MEQATVAIESASTLCLVPTLTGRPSCLCHPNHEGHGGDNSKNHTYDETIILDICILGVPTATELVAEGSRC